MSKHGVWACFNRLWGMLCAGFILLLAGSIATVQGAESPEIGRGLDWLTAQVAADGSVGGEQFSIANPRQSAAETLLTLADFDAGALALAQRIGSDVDTATEVLARSAIALTRAGQAPTTAITLLRARQNADGGFGDSDGARSNSLDTAWTLLAFHVSGFGEAASLKAALDYLVASAQADGSFATPDRRGSIFATSYALQALAAYREAYASGPYIARATDWLRSARGSDNSYGQTLYDALATLALAANTTDSTQYADLVAALKAAQAEDGSWQHDPFLTSLALRALGGKAQPPPTIQGRVTGQVVDAASRVPLKDASVSVNGLSVLTDTNGRFQTAGLGSGAQPLTINRPGYASRQVLVNISTGTTTDAGIIALDVMANSAVVRGVVTDGASGQALSGVTVRIEAAGQQLSALSASNGAFEIGGVPAGDGTVAVEKTGYRSLSTSLQFIGGTSYHFSPALYADGETAPTRATLQGRVIAADTASPVSGAVVSVGSQNTATTADGSFTLGDLSPGDTQIRVEASGYLTASYQGVLSAGTNKVGDLRLQPATSQGRVKGQVIDAATRAPLAGASVRVAGLSLLTDPNGRFEIGVPIGSQSLMVAKAGYSSAQLQLTVTGGGLVDVGGVALAVQSDRALVRGVVLDGANGQPLAGAGVVVAVDGVSLSAQTADNGAYELSGIPAGGGSITAQKAGYRSAVATAGFAAGSSYNYSPTLYAEDAEAPTKATLTGRIIAADTAAAIGGAQVAAGGRSTTSAADGSFSVDQLEPGSVEIGVQASGYDAATFTGMLSAGVNRVGDLRLQLTATTLTLFGEVINAEGGAVVPGAVVSVQGTNLRAVTNARGSYRIEGIPETHLNLVVEASGYYSQSFAVNAPRFGSFETDFPLLRAEDKGIRLSASTDLPAYDPFSDVRIAVVANNEHAQDRQLVFTATVYDSERRWVERVPFKQLTLGMQATEAAYLVPASASVDLGAKWYNQLVPPGDYSIVVAAAELSGEIVAETTVGLSINPKVAIGGGLTVDPPITQAGTNEPVNISAAISNRGNLPYPGGPARLSIVLDVPDTSATLAGHAAVKELLIGSPLSAPRGGVNDEAGNLYTVNQGRQVIKVMPTGSAQVLATLPISVLPVDIARLGDGRLQILASSGAIYTVTETGLAAGSTPSGLTTGQALTTDAGGNIFAAGFVSANEAVIRIDPNGQRTELLRKGFSTPSGIAKGTDGKYYVTNFYDNNLMRVDATGRIESFAIGLSRPSAVLARSGGDFLVADGSRIARVSPTGAVTDFATGISSPQALAFAPSGEVLVSASGTSSVERVSTAGVVSRFSQSFGSQPAAAAYGADGQLYVAGADGSLRRLNGSGAIENLLTSGKLGASVRDLVASGAGDLYSTNANSIYRYQPSTGTTSAVNLGSFSGLSGLAVDDADRLLIVESTGNRINRSTSSTTREIIAQPLISSPVAVVAAGDGTRYILNASNLARIPTSGRAGTFVATLAGSPQDMALRAAGGVFYLVNRTSLRFVTAAGALNTRATVPASRRIAAAADGTVFLVDDTSNKIHRLRPNMNAAEVFATTATRVRDIDVDATGALVAALEDGYLYRFADNGTSSPGTSVGDVVAMSTATDGSTYVLTGEGEFVRVDPNGQKSLLVSGISGGRSFARLSSGAFDILEDSSALLRQYDSANVLQRTVAGFNAPVDVEWMDGAIVFADSAYGRIYKMSPDDGVPVLYAGVHVDQLHYSAGSLYGSINDSGRIVSIAPGGVVADDYANALLSGMSGFAMRGKEVAIADKAQDRVLVIADDRSVKASYVALSAPGGIAIDGQGLVYVANSTGVVRFSADGKQSELLPLASPKALTLGPDGALWASSNQTAMRYDGERFVPVAEGPNPISAMLFDGDQLYVTDSVAVRRKMQGQLQYFAGGVRNTKALRVGADNTLYMASGAGNSIVTRYANGDLSMVASGFGPVQAMTARADGLYVGDYSSVYRVDPATGVVEDQGLDKLIPGADFRGLASGADGSLLAVAGNKSAVYQLEPGKPGTAPAPGTEVHNVQLQLNPIPVGGSPLDVSLGQWIPPYAGDYSLHLTQADGAAAGELVSQLHVGPHAEGKVTADRDYVPPGDASLRLTAAVSGADFTTLSKAYPENLRHLLQATRPFAMGTDPAGNIYLADTAKIVRVRPDGVIENVYTTAGGATALTTYGGLPVDRQSNLYVGNASNQLLRIRPNGVVEIVTTLADDIRGLVLDSRDGLYAVLSNSFVYKIAQDGVATRINVVGASNVYAITMDGRDTLYLFRRDHTTIKLGSSGGATVVDTADAIFEYEGMPVAGDCADNLLMAPVRWVAMGQEYTEEHTLVQIPGNGSPAAKIFDGFSANPQLPDLDFIVYDRYGQALLMWTDQSNRVSRMPISCGAISTDLHLITPVGQSLSGYSLVPNMVVTNEDGSTEHVWSLQDVTALGQSVQFDTVLADMKLGEDRDVAQEAYLVFRNTFTGGSVKLPLQLPTVRTGGLVTMTVATDRSAYPANTDVVIDLAVNNPNPMTVQGRLRLDLVDSQGRVLQTMFDEEQSLEGGTLNVLHPPLNSGAYPAATYQLKGSFTDGSGYLQAEASAQFGITASGTDPGTDPAVKVAPATDKTVYGEFETVQLLAPRSLAANYSYEDLTQLLTVVDPNGAQVFSEARVIERLSPNGTYEQRGSYKLPGGLVGVFGVHAAILDRNGSVIATGTTSFEARADDAATLSGSVVATRKVVPVSESQTCRDTVVNSGQRALSELPIRQSVVELASDRVVSTTTRPYDLAAGSQQQLSRVFSTEGYALGQHACVLEAQLNGQWKALGYDVFTVDPPPVRVTATLELGKKGRILMLLDGVPVAGSSKSEPAPEVQRSFLERLLEREGWAYTIVTDADAFAWELRSGDYNTYALFSEGTKLDERVQKELREAVYRGEGLLEAGAHDQRHHGFDDALGLKYQGKLADVTGVEMTAAEPGPAGYADITLRDKPLRAQLDAAVSLGRYLGGKTDDPSASATRSYGRGRSIYFGYDLLAEAVLAGDSSFHARLLVQGLAHVQPAYAEALAGRVVPLRITLQNEGNATPGQLRLPMPSGAVIVDRGTAMVQGDTLVWNYQLEADEKESFVAWLRLPLATGPLTFTAEVLTGPAGALVPQGTGSLSLQVTADSGLGDARQLAASAAEFKQVLNWLDKADAALRSNDADSALAHLVKASDELLKVSSHASAGQLRLMIDQALLDAGRLYWGG